MKTNALSPWALASALLALGALAQSSPDRVDPALFKDLRYRMVGPSRGGRVTAYAGHRKQPGTFYIGATGGGVWKTTDYGVTWAAISDGFFATGSIGAIAVAESDPNVIYVGTGSAGIRSNVIQGRGVYKSVDAGRTWSFVGLRDVGQIGDALVHPQNPDIAYLAALGQPFGPNPERGVFRTGDGGKTWKKVLFVNDRTGAVKLSMNPQNPREIYAGAWRGERKPWTIISGGPASETGLYKTTDGGDTWTHLTKGLPQTLIGKIDVDVSPANPSRVYVLLEAPGEERGVYRSDDGGGSFRQMSSQLDLIRRPFYYTHLTAHPKDADTVFINNERFFKSTDGGSTWRTLQTPHGDNHGMWINPDNPDVFIQVNDGGGNVTTNGGQTWSSQNNQPTAELYQVEADDRLLRNLEDLQDKVQVPFQARCIHHNHRHIRLAEEDKIPRHFFIRAGGEERVGAGKVDQFVSFPIERKRTFRPHHGFPGPVPRVLAQAGEAVKDRALPHIRISSQRNYELKLPGLQPQSDQFRILVDGADFTLLRIHGCHGVPVDSET